MPRQDARCGDAGSEDRRLGIFRQPQVFFGTFEDQFRQRKPKRFIRFGKGLCGYGKSFSEAAAHADRLRSLTREKECDLSDHFREDSILFIRFVHPADAPAPYTTASGRKPASCIARVISGLRMNVSQTCPVRRFSAIRTEIPRSIPSTSGLYQLAAG